MKHWNELNLKYFAWTVMSVPHSWSWFNLKTHDSSKTLVTLSVHEWQALAINSRGDSVFFIAHTSQNL